nr:hypothetical protein [uncultured Dysosmobacter sp.]
MDASTTTTVLSAVVTSDMVSGVLNEVVALLPVILPAAIGFIAIRKGVSFVLGMLRSA